MNPGRRREGKHLPHSAGNADEGKEEWHGLAVSQRVVPGPVVTHHTPATPVASIGVQQVKG